MPLLVRKEGVEMSRCAGHELWAEDIVVGCPLEATKNMQVQGTMQSDGLDAYVAVCDDHAESLRQGVYLTIILEPMDEKNN
jgi:hypothetical protein